MGSACAAPFFSTPRRVENDHHFFDIIFFIFPVSCNKTEIIQRFLMPYFD